jgi:hypothetical protein
MPRGANKRLESALGERFGQSLNAESSAYKYLISADNIGKAGKNPFIKAAYITNLFKKSKSSPASAGVRLAKHLYRFVERP